MAKSEYHNPTLLVEIRARHFNYHGGIYPSDFMDYYYKLSVSTPSMKTLRLQATRYCSGAREPRVSGRQEWLKAVKKHYAAAGWPMGLETWIKSDRDSAVFHGHGLPEELSMVCQMALDSGYKNEQSLPSWVDQMLGIDCNGFVNAYLTCLGTFSHPLHSHPSFINVTPPAKDVAEIDYDSVIVTAKSGGGVKVNPGDEGAHIMVVDSWDVKNSSLLVCEQPGKDYPGPVSSIYDIIKAPPASANKKLEYLWTIRKRGNSSTYDKLVYITREMGSY